MATTITVNITDADQTALENDLVDIDAWVQAAVAGKINSCRKRLIKEWQPKVFADPAVASIPADDGEFIASVIARPDYKNRAAREAESKAESE